MVNIYVGPSKRHYAVHQNLICSISPFFDSAINGPFAEAKNKEVTLPEDDVMAFDMLVVQIYTGNVPNFIVNKNSVAINLIVFYYPLLDKLMVPDFYKIEAMDKYIRSVLELSLLPSPFTTARALRETDENDPFHKLQLEIAVYRYCFSKNNEDGHLERCLEGCSDVDKIEMIRVTKLMMERQLKFQLRRTRCTHFRYIMEMENFTSIADIPRYQIGYLVKKDSTETSKKRPTSAMAMETETETA